MQAKRDLYVGIGALMAILALISFGAIGLFSRMTPAIERILQENDYSLAAAEEMLAVAARTAGRTASTEEVAAFDRALARASENITEPAERQVIADLREQAPAALAGETFATDTLVARLQQLADINREAMHRVDREAKRLGTAGAWSAVVLGFVGFAMGLAVIALLQRRILDPIAELYDTAVAARRGERGRRCHVSDAPEEITFVMKLVNDLFDHRDRAQRREERTHSESQFADRVVLLHLLDGAEVPTAIVDADGELVTANARAMEMLEGEDATRYREALRRIPGGAVPDAIAEASEIPDAGRWLATLR